VLGVVEAKEEAGRPPKYSKHKMNEEVGEGPLQASAASAVGEQTQIDVGTSSEWPTERNPAVDKWETATIQASRQLMAILNEDDDDLPSFMVVTPSQYHRICFVAWKAMATQGRSSRSHAVRIAKQKAEMTATSKQMSSEQMRLRGATYLGTFLFHRITVELRNAFGIWARAAKGVMRIKSKFFHRWNSLMTRNKLNRLKAMRMASLLPALNEAAVKRLNQRAWDLWGEGIAHRKTMRHVKLYLTCWRTVTRSCKQGRKVRMRLAMHDWHRIARERAGRAQKVQLRLVFRRFLRPVKRKQLLLKVATLGHCTLPMRQALYTWLMACSHSLQRRAATMAVQSPTRNDMSPRASLNSTINTAPNTPSVSGRNSVRRPSTNTRQPSSTSKVNATPRSPVPATPVRVAGGPARTPRTAATPSSRVSAAWTKELMNVSCLTPATVASYTATSSRSLLPSPEKKTSTSAARGPKPTNKKNSAVSALLANPMERFKMRLEGLKNVSELL